MFRRLAPVLLALPLVLGCAGPNTLARRSEEKLASNPRRAWDLAIRALDKEPGNVRAREAAAAAAGAIAQDWQNRIRALAGVDSITAAEQVLEFVAFRAGAVRYATVPVDPAWSTDEKNLRHTAARIHYQRGALEMDARRPKKAFFHYSSCERFVPVYRDAARLASRAMDKATTRVAFVPLRGTARGTLGRDVAASWRGECVERMNPPHALFTRILPSEDVERQMTVSDLSAMSRDQAIRVAKRAGADRLVWGTIGGVDARNSIQMYTEAVYRRVVEKDSEGNRSTRWVAVPIEVIARVRDVAVDLEYEVISARGGATLARRREPCTMSARAVWTASMLDGELDSFALYSDAMRSEDPERCKAIETRWKAVVGEGTTLRQVIEARRAKRSSGNERAEAVARWIAGAAFVMLEDLPPTDELAYAALARGWKTVHADLQRLDEFDEVDLGLATAEPERR